jgi:drug/metabolite transporter (DMT)-like permease
VEYGAHAHYRGYHVHGGDRPVVHGRSSSLASGSTRPPCSTVPRSQLAALLTLGVWNTTIAQFLWIGGLANVPDITRGSYLFFLKPVIAAFLAVMFLADSITTWQYLAILVICVSVFGGGQLEPLL